MRSPSALHSKIRSPTRISITQLVSVGAITTRAHQSGYSPDRQHHRQACCRSTSSRCFDRKDGSQFMIGWRDRLSPDAPERLVAQSRIRVKKVVGDDHVDTGSKSPGFNQIAVMRCNDFSFLRSGNNYHFRICAAGFVEGCWHRPVPLWKWRWRNQWFLERVCFETPVVNKSKLPCWRW